MSFVSGIDDGVLASDGHRILLSTRVGTLLAQVYANFKDGEEKIMFQVVDAGSIGSKHSMAGGLQSEGASIMQVLDYDEMTNLLADLANEVEIPFNIMGESEGKEN